MDRSHEDKMIRRANQLLGGALRHAHDLASCLREIDKSMAHDVLGFASKRQMFRLGKLEEILEEIWRVSA